MRYTVLHASPKRVRIHILQLRMTDSQAEQLEEYLFSFANVDKVRADERTGNVTLHFTGDCEPVLSALSEFAYDRSREHEPCSHGRMLIREFEQDLLAHISRRVMRWLLIPDFLKPVMAGVQAIPYVLTALKTLARGKLDVTVLDGASVTVSLLAGDHDTSSSIMFLLGLSEILEDYTHRKSVDDLARAMELNIDKVWRLNEQGEEELVNVGQIREGDTIVVRTANTIPLDATVLTGEMTVNQSSFTGESLPVLKKEGAPVYAGTAVEEGECYCRVIHTSGHGRYDRIVRMIEESEALRLAGCLEEHYPHSIANAVVKEAENRKLFHEERHSRVEYIVAHGIASSLEGKKTIIGSPHFVFEDEHCVIPEGEQEKYEAIDPSCSHLCLAVGGVLAAVICIEDPLRTEAPDIIQKLRERNLKHIVMLTGDSEKTAAVIAKQAGVDDYRAEVLPEDKADYIRKAREEGRTVIMIGDGVNDSPALSESDCGIAVSDGAAIAREIADVTIADDDLYTLLTLKDTSDLLQRRIHRNYRFIMTFNSTLILLGALGVLSASTSAWLHNLSTLMISADSMTPLLRRDRNETSHLRA